MLILIDQDNVLADFEAGFVTAWQAAGHTAPALPPEARRTFYIRDDYPEPLRERVQATYLARGFFRTLPPVSGAVEAVRGLMVAGHEVRICTSPLNDYRHCVTEKYEWVEQHFGAAMVEQMILTKDKTWVRGDLLIDDKPEVTGVLTPSWQHVIFDRPYNRQVLGRRITWPQWKSLL